MSMRSCGSSSSPTAHITFCTLIELLRPQILSIYKTPQALRRRGPAWAPTRKQTPALPRGQPQGLPLHDMHRVLWLFQRTRFLRQHDRDAVADRIGQFCRAGNQLLLLRVVFQRALGQRADEDFQKFWVDTAGGSIGGHGVSWTLRGLVCP